MKIEVLADADAVARKAAAIIAADARTAVGARGRFVMAVSGGQTPLKMLDTLSKRDDIPWRNVYVAQVDERIAPAGHTDRNLTHLRECLFEHSPLLHERIYAMPVEHTVLAAAAAKYARTIEEIAGFPPVLDLVHLGLGADGHTASLIPNDNVINVAEKDVAITEAYQGYRRMTLTYPILNRARRILWIITGGEKAKMLSRLLAGDETIPAARIRRDNALVLTDIAAAH
jgi:6-phosphogluconolactonase